MQASCQTAFERRQESGDVKSKWDDCGLSFALIEGPGGADVGSNLVMVKGAYRNEARLIRLMPGTTSFAVTQPHPIITNSGMHDGDMKELGASRPCCTCTWPLTTDVVRKSNELVTLSNLGCSSI
jgi:hypothetical protein